MIKLRRMILAASGAALMLSLSAPVPAAELAMLPRGAHEQALRWLTALVRPAVTVPQQAVAGAPFPGPRALLSGPPERSRSHRGMMLASLALMLLIVRRRSVLH